MNRFVVGLVIVAVAAGAYYFSGEEKSDVQFTLVKEKIERGNIRKIVTASGTINPVVKVEVGSQVSGQIIELQKDFNDTVQEGELIAKIDPQKFEMRVKQQEADLRIAESQVLQQRATLKSELANFDNAKRQYERQSELQKEGIASEASFDNAELAYQLATQRLEITKAQLENAIAVVEQRKSTLEQARIDLEYCYIRSPINGVVIERNVNIGQTVAASFSAPILFQLAQDLSDVRVEASVDEADIGGVEEGQQVTFSVDAYLDRTFSGTVEQVRYAAVVEQNVVTYTVTILAKNEELLLLPGMTANVEIITGQRNDVMRIANAAFRYQPSPDLLPEDAQEQPSTPFGGGGGGFDPDRIATRMVDRMKGQITLSDEQAEQVADKFKELFKEGAGAMRRMRGGAIYDEFNDILSEEQIKTLKDAAQARAAGGGRQAANRGRPAQVWVQSSDTGFLEQRFVRIGVQDDQFTEILGGQLQEGSEVVVGIRQ